MLFELNKINFTGCAFAYYYQLPTALGGMALT
jgi:hypothetical protein